MIRRKKTETRPPIQAIRSATPSPSKKRGEEKALVSQLSIENIGNDLDKSKSEDGRQKTKDG